MTLNELKYFCELAKQKHFRKASEQCFVSQPTLSVAIKKLETELDVTLFERRKQNVLLTPIGEKILPIAQKMLQEAKSIKELAQAEQSQTAELKIGAIYTIGPYLLPHVISAFHAVKQSVRLTIEENYTYELAKKLQSGELDAVLVSLPFDEPNIECLPLYEEPFYASLPKQHPLAEKASIDLSDLENETLLLLGAGHCFRDQIFDAYPLLSQARANDQSLQKTLEGGSLETIRYMVASGAGVTILPCSACQNSDELLTYLPLAEKDAKRTVVLAWRKSFPNLDALNAFKKTLQSSHIPCTDRCQSD
ncbi:hydrogen peroxide-inducible genes activator [Thiomicrospira sp. WB1]|uniref:hydrogen peroxide-inducible genes activator n=1 Tax=Thiomicrospira sp. WB1 TaxID=1685380 RepID=UPI00074AECAB|nr:hydrogen peroxide-inducible genes activator [Thiomicrospira sp. WB1]KUJ72284.1 LysR family transcriptional regulator [Thiomicrospira sp. WB1]